MILCTQAQSRLQDGEDPEDVLAFVQGETVASQLSAADDKPQSIAEWVMPTLRELQSERTHEGNVLGIPTGIRDLDAVTTGWRDGELAYVGAYPGRGKTALLLQSIYAAARSGCPAGIISLEMRQEKLMRRLGVMHSRLSSTKFRDPRTMSPEEWRRAETALLDLGGFPIMGTDVAGLNAAKIARCARQMHAAGARVIFVDFIQIVHENGKDRREAINKVSAALRDTCKSLNIPFVVASQLARRDSDVNRRPTMQDLRESGNLEQDAHKVLLIYRPVDKNTDEFTGEDEIIVAKQREGITGSVRVRYDDQALWFRSRRPELERVA